MTRSRSIDTAAAFVLFVMVAALGGTARAGAQDAGAEAITRVEAAWAEALTANDLPALEAIYADDLVYIHSTGSTETKAQFLDSIGSGRLQFVAVTQRDFQVQTYADTAVVSALYDLSLTTRRSTEPTQMAIRYLTVYVRQAGEWRIVAQQTTRLPEPSR